MRTAVGNVREHNEDHAYVDSDHRYFVVADGMGGQDGGEVASAMAVAVVRNALDAAADVMSTITGTPTQAERGWMRSLLERAVRAANDAVVARGHRDRAHHGMGTTLDVVVILGDQAFVAHVGDSRTYLIRDNAALQLTSDHTVAQAMVDIGVLTREEAARSPMRSVLCNAVGGGTPDIAIDHVHIQLRPGDRVLACTDGLYDYFDEQELALVTSAESCESALDSLIRAACERGGDDNLTGIAIEIAEAAVPIDPLEDAPTQPFSIPIPRAGSAPLAGISDDALAGIVEQVLREVSRSHPVARPDAITQSE